MDTFNKLADLFRHFPGIGPRQAKRFVFFLLSRDKAFLEELTKLIAALQKEIIQCPECFRFFQKSKSNQCRICADQSRTVSELMIVAKDVELDAMEKSGTFHGRYFVLGGTIPLVERKTAEKLRLKELAARVAKETKNRTLQEVILALSANPDGEHTADVLRSELSPIASKNGIKISTLGRGLSTGSELEYADSETIKSALKNRSN